MWDLVRLLEEQEGREKEQHAKSDHEERGTDGLLASLQADGEAVDDRPSLPSRGWMLVYSHVLHDAVLWAENERVAQRLNAHPSTAGVTIYTRKELVLLTQADPSPHELQVIHAAKKILGGAVIDCQEPSRKREEQGEGI